MKKLLFSLLATVFFAGASSAQELRTNTKVPTTVALTAKYHAVITYLETKELYRDGMSRDAFVKATTAGVDDQTAVTVFSDYMSKIYEFHTRRLTPDAVYDSVDGSDFVVMINKLTQYEESNGHQLSLKKPRWFNWLRKAIDFIDDHWA